MNSSTPVHAFLQDFLGGIVAGYATHSPSALGRRSAKKEVRVLRLHAPLPDFLLAFGKGPGQISVKNVSLWQVNLLFQIDSAHRLDAGITISIRSEAFLDWFVEVPVDPREVSLQGGVASPLIIFLEQAVGHVQTKEGEGVKTLRLELRRKDGGVGQGVTVNFAGWGIRAFAPE